MAHTHLTVHNHILWKMRSPFTIHTAFHGEQIHLPRHIFALLHIIAFNGKRIHLSRYISPSTVNKFTFHDIYPSSTRHKRLLRYISAFHGTCSSFQYTATFTAHLNLSRYISPSTANILAFTTQSLLWQTQPPPMTHIRL